MSPAKRDTFLKITGWLPGCPVNKVKKDVVGGKHFSAHHVLFHATL
jgi:hypothetical protein